MRRLNVHCGIATSGQREATRPALKALGIGDDATIVDGSSARPAKPAPDLFLECARRLDAIPSDCFVVGDSIWDMLVARRAGIQAIGVLSGGYGEAELYQAGAYRVYRDPGTLLDALGQLGIGV